MVTWPIILKHFQCLLLWAHIYNGKFTRKPKIAELIIYGIFSKWRHSDRKLSKMVPCLTKWPNDHIWPYFRQKPYSGGILKIIVSIKNLENRHWLIMQHSRACRRFRLVNIQTSNQKNRKKSAFSKIRKSFQN